MMVQRPQQWIESMADAGVDQYTFHIEPVLDDVEDISRKIRESGMKVGLALKPSTSLDAVEKYIPLADMILVMTGWCRLQFHLCAGLESNSIHFFFQLNPDSEDRSLWPTKCRKYNGYANTILS